MYLVVFIFDYMVHCFGEVIMMYMCVSVWCYEFYCVVCTEMIILYVNLLVVLGMAQLVNHFAIVGLNSEDLREHVSKHDFLTNTYTPKVLSYFPHDKKFDVNAICTMCLPDGLHLKQTPFPEDEKPEFHSFLITKEDGSRTYGCALCFYEVTTDQALLDAVKNQEQIAENALIVSESDEGLQKGGGSLCIQKCICLISSFQHVSPLKQYLLQLHKTTIGGQKLSLPFEKYLSNLLYDVPAPLPGKTINFHGPLSKLTCKMPGVLDFSLCDYSLLPLVQKIGLKNLVKVFTCVLLEHQLLIKSASYSELMECSEWLTTLLCPFTWQHVYVPILPASQYMFLDAPVPYIMGLKASFDFCQELDITNEGSLCMLDLNRGSLEVPEDLPAFPELENFLGRLQEIAESHNVECTDLREFSLSPTQSRNQHGVINLLQSYFQRDKKNDSSEEIVKLAGMATRAGIEEEVTSPASSVTSDLGNATSPVPDEVDSEKFVLDIREAFVQRFIDLLRDYEKFTIYPKQSYDQWKRDREQFQNFDRTAFLSDQPEKNLPFLSAFLETQMFRSFVDEKIEAYYSKDPSKHLALFDNKIELAAKERSELMRSPVFEKAPVILEEPSTPTYDGTPLTIEIPPPSASKPIEDDGVCLQPLGVFPNLDLSILQRHRSSSPSMQETTGSLEKKRQRKSFGVLTNEPSASRQIIARHAKFVMQLWRESRVRVKNLVGSTPNAKSSVEENTQIANLCDLLERIWSHGLVAKRDGKSPLWSHLMAYAETDTTHCEVVPSGASPPISTKQVRSTSPKKDRSVTPTQNIKAQLKRTSLQSPGLHERVSALLSPPTASLIDDILAIKMMTEIKTDVGRMRAWVRLALEKKLLYKHLVELLSNKVLRDSRYKDYAFLRTEDEKEQFLLHMLTLNAKDFSCFTKGFKDSSMHYRVLVVSEGKRFGVSTACLYCNLSGKYNSSGTTWFTKDNTVDIKCQNLGPITCIRIGHDNTGLLASTWIDSVLVQNMTTGHTYHFPCQQWLSRTEGDGSTERFLVARKLDCNPMASPPSIDSLFPADNSRKKAARRDSKEPQVLSDGEMNYKIMKLVQNIVISSANDDNQQLNYLLGPDGFMYYLEQILLFEAYTNRKSKKPFVWDLIEKMSTKITCMHEADKAAAEKMLVVIAKLENQMTGIGKTEKFHILISAGINYQLLDTWIRLLAYSSATLELYAVGSFLLDENKLRFLIVQLKDLPKVPIPIPALLLESLS